MSLTTPVEVSLWTMQTALMAWPVSSFRRLLDGRRIGRLAPVAAHELRLDSSLSAIFFHSEAKWPVSHISTRSPATGC
jgi:hypothetical protein